MSERLDAWHYQSMICVLVVSCDCVMILYLMLCFVVFLLDLKFVQIVLGTQLCFCFQKKIWLCQYRYFFVLDQLMYALFFFFYRKNHFIGRKKTQEMHLLLICHCVQSINVVAGLYYSHYLPQYMLSVL